MRIYLFIRRIVIFTSLVLICGLPALATQAADQPSGGAPPVVVTGEPGTMAAGVEDTLKACLARIPKGGSSGQRMLAKQSCKQDEGTRKASQDASKF